MGSENLYHKRKAKAQNISRKKSHRQPYPKVLIVCEGSKTEQFYFEDFRDHYELASTNVKVSSDCGSAPINVVDHGIELYKQEIADKKEAFDRVYFVFDRDAHSTYHQALNVISSAKPVDTFFAITSTPSFEYWYLLHFGMIQRSFNGTGRLSPAEELEAYLKANYWPLYKKNMKGCFKELLVDLPRAKAWADSVGRASKASGSINPLTNVHELVEYLQGIKNKL